MHTNVVVNDLTSAALSLSAFCGQANAPTKEALPSCRTARKVEEERRSPFEYQVQFQWRGWTRTVDSRHSGGCAWAGISERVPYKSSRIPLCLWHSLFEWYSVFSSSPLPVFSRKHFPAVEIQILVYGSDSSFQYVPDWWGAPYNGECI